MIDYILLTLIVIEILFIAYMIWDNVEWQKSVLMYYSPEAIKKRKKVKLKKGQKIIFEEEEDKYNPFEEIASANTNPERQRN